ncbi:hypothetical protein L1787_20910 [Acuticoccus sp. M5D2P5]|uniref:hypothetical protein n=1 Tax=Acuticoccus kalidii TaxID=2910977 RepID=UPI001F3EB27B|nr:hypothetical protein [Acuticoccus kalidii]MCF3935855.1 hypothetical protein [Acuticoccus kalidii]
MTSERQPMDNAAELIAELSVDYWKLLRAFERARDAASPDRSARLTAQARYAESRLVAGLQAAGMRLATFDGETFSAELPVSALNAEDFTDRGAETLRIASTVEPAIIRDMTVIRTGKALVEAAPAETKPADED